MFSVILDVTYALAYVMYSTQLNENREQMSFSKVAKWVDLIQSQMRNSNRYQHSEIMRQ